DGRRLGTHDGVPQFTIGQRRGLGVALGAPVYVSTLDAATSTITVGPRESVLAAEAAAERMHWLGDEPSGPFHAHVRIRYNHDAASAIVSPISGQRVRVRF